MDNAVLSLTITDRSTLYSSYLSFLPNGGIFIPTKKSHKLGDPIFLLLRILDSTQKIPIEGRVVWLTPLGAQGNKAVGVGVEFSKHSKDAKSIIEGYLATTLKSDRLTYTM